MNFENIPVTSQFSIRVINQPNEQYSLQTQQSIDKIWEEEKKLRGTNLYNGRVFSLVLIEKDCLIGKFVDYKSYVASLRDPEIANVTHIISVGMTGMTTSGNKILIGKRAPHVTLYPNFYEFAPAGTIDPSSLVFDHIDINRQIVAELTEETGISEKMVDAIIPFAAIKNLDTGEIEIGIKITLDSMAEDNPITSTQEYPNLFWVDLKELPNFVKRHKEQFVPVSVYLNTIFHSSVGQFGNT